MPISSTLQPIFKWLLILSSLLLVYSYFTKDTLPEADFYNLSELKAPKQTAIKKNAFSVEVNNQTYIIKPRFYYELQGVVVSYHDSDVFWDIWHHDKWKDFINLRDLCVIWDNNVSSGVYKKMDFTNDSWTCWARWPDNETGRIFSMRQLSNNHILSHNDDISQTLMSARPGDHIKLSGFLSEYSNPGNGFQRGTSTTRTDTGNGACETIYLDDFKIINKANAGTHRLYAISKWTFIISLIGFIVAFIASPVCRN
ncbi:hypothetical protein MNBD_GAMMA09-3823 [hydrothermal vent metagenome]|uniref:Uncharacterized protein n=1 Tax=hydrothermal vent metagenome TaxID=652676 RepID=A0A3B0YLV0_9ZZZZ